MDPRVLVITDMGPHVFSDNRHMGPRVFCDNRHMGPCVFSDNGHMVPRVLVGFVFSLFSFYE